MLGLLTYVFGGGASRAGAGAGLEELVPRLWPLFRHTLTRVRLATVQCLQAFLQGPQLQPWLTTSVLQTALRYLLLLLAVTAGSLAWAFSAGVSTV